jgi:hypothetical protein
VSKARHRRGNRKKVPYVGLHRTTPEFGSSAISESLRHPGIRLFIAIPLALMMVLYPYTLGDDNGRFSADAEEVIIEPGNRPDELLSPSG